jgi:type II secretory pathway pseudopilin PulG
MKKLLLMQFVIILISANAYAQQSLHDQINAVDDVQEQSEADARAAQDLRQRQWDAQQQAASAVAQQRRAAIEDMQRQKQAEAASDKKRDEEYEDKLRAIDLQEKTLQIEAQKARVVRSNDYIDQELKEKAAETDVIKSKADSTRNISEGTKSLLEKTGDAEVKQQSGWFGN